MSKENPNPIPLVSAQNIEFGGSGLDPGSVAVPAEVIAERVEIRPGHSYFLGELSDYSNCSSDKQLHSKLPAPPEMIRSPAAELIAQAIKGEYRYAMLALILGLTSMIGGVILGIRGVTGSTSWTAKLLGLSSTINDAAPGVVLFVVGLFMVWATRPKIKLRDLK